jgi:hypothetical protein
MGKLPAFVGLLLLALILAPANAAAQCILWNPSFEMAGSGSSQSFMGWNEFGSTSSVAEADHGLRAARVRGPNFGDPGVSGFWQSQDCVPGEQWKAAGRVRTSSSRPLVGGSYAMVNIEWRDAGENLISYETFEVANPADPTDQYLDFEVTSSPAPAGTETTRVLFAVLQPSGAPSGDVYYDAVSFESQTYPTLNDVQWNDFPGETTWEFAGYNWRVKGPGYYGPGPNLFDDSFQSVWVDAQDRLHLTTRYQGGAWYSSEIVLKDPLGYGDYILTTESELDQLDPQVVLGIFLWQYGPCWDYSFTSWNAFNEIDIEYSRWGDPNAEVAQFVTQPWDYPGNRVRFDPVFKTGERMSHAIRWLADRVEYRVWRGEAWEESPSTLVHSWTYTGPHIPRPEQPRLHLNLWKLSGDPVGDQEVIFTNFAFVPEGGSTAVDDRGDGFAPVASGRLLSPRPNPFNPSTTLRFELQREGRARLEIFDLAGRRVRTLLDESRPAGIHEIAWDGRGEDGNRVASGVYLVRLEGQGFVESRRVALVK